MSNFTKAYKNAAECIGTSILISFILFYIIFWASMGCMLVLSWFNVIMVIIK